MERSGAETPLLPRAGDALVVVDVQRDFLPGGRLAVPDGSRVIAPLNAWVEQFVVRGLPVIATRDWHPSNHSSFAAQGGPWPPHCVAGTPGAAFAAALRLPSQALIVSKGSAVKGDAYSAFSDTGLRHKLRATGVERLFVGGLATDYCVLHTVLDARALGFEVAVLLDAIAAVDARPGDGEAALARMREAGARLVGWGDRRLRAA
jgi:nicotinamidase/pyrazinamidase